MSDSEPATVSRLLPSSIRLPAMVVMPVIPERSEIGSSKRDRSPVKVTCWSAPMSVRSGLNPMATLPKVGLHRPARGWLRSVSAQMFNQDGAFTYNDEAELCTASVPIQFGVWLSQVAVTDSLTLDSALALVIILKSMARRTFSVDNSDQASSRLLLARMTRTYQQLDDMNGDLLETANDLRQQGRHARAQADDVNSRRRDEVASSARSALMNGGGMLADGFVPGLGTAIGAARSAHSVRERHLQGRSGGAEVARQGVSTGAGFIPVIGNFLGFAEDLCNAGWAVLQSKKGRKADKLERVQKIRNRAAEFLPQIEDARTSLRDYQGTDRAKIERRLDKAEERLREAQAAADRWIANNADGGNLPLTSGAASSNVDSGEWAIPDDPSTRWIQQLNELRASNEIYRLLEASGDCPYDIAFVKRMSTLRQQVDAYDEMLLYRSWTLSPEEVAATRASDAYRDWVP